MKIVAKGINPVNQVIYLSFKYQGFCPIIDRTTLTLHGNRMFFLLIPKNEPMSTRGVEMQIQRTSNTANSETENPSLDFSNENIILTMNKVNKDNPGNRTLVKRLHLSQSLPPFVLYK